MDQQILMMLPGLQPDELMTIQNLTKDFNDNQKQQFFMLYKGKRKEQQELMFMTLAGFLGVAGIQRFVVGEVGLGVVYFLTLGFCGIGTIVDLINVKKMAYEYNAKQAMECANMIKMMVKKIN